MTTAELTTKSTYSEHSPRNRLVEGKRIMTNNKHATILRRAARVAAYPDDARVLHELADVVEQATGEIRDTTPESVLAQIEQHRIALNGLEEQANAIKAESDAERAREAGLSTAGLVKRDDANE